MACCRQPCFLSPKLSLPVLAFAMWLVVAETAAPIPLRGEVGGNVTFKAPTVKQGKTKFMYLQKDNVFINGYYSEKKITQPVWQNTRVDNNTNEVHMFGLNMSHSGDYDLYIQYSNDPIPTKRVIQLSVTGKYTTPSVTLVCSDENNFKSCIVTCASNGGFPLSNMTWNVSGTENTSKIWKVLNSTNDQSKDTKLFTSSSSSYFNCSSGELKFSCSVGGVTSDERPVCAHQDPPNNHSLHVIIAACVVIVVVITFGLLWWRWKKRPKGTTAVVQKVAENQKSDGCEEEIVVLTESKEGTEAS